eukprot:CAMPEP_0116075540 /NCGR_PEP_ID=MMETSP0322-20121206/16692_1 /TAXON_ID=163516 /ORGANISM="Leptocylindrus danicus var. apora, Strain B651" /LENGTH=309 /DNA_ID=CAMNT_0003565611 /DNA_START=1 /DNA_END=929 /DNA_ORIENTATION=+
MLGVHAMFENVEDAKRAPTVINVINFGRKKLQANYDGILTNPVSDVSKIKVDEMTAIFGKFKAIEFPKASRDKEREGHNNKGYAFVEFQWPNEADLAIKKLHGISVFGRKPLRIDLMDPRGKRTNMKEVNRSVGSQNDRNGRGVPSQDKKDVQTESPSLSSDKNDLIGKGSQEQTQLKMGRNLRVNVTENIDRRPNGKSSNENGIKESNRRDGSNDEDANQMASLLMKMELEVQVAVMDQAITPIADQTVVLARNPMQMVPERLIDEIMIGECEAQERTRHLVMIDQSENGVDQEREAWNEMTGTIEGG